MTIGILPLGRATFDVEFANRKLAAMLARLDATGRAFAGPRELLFDAGQARAAIAELRAAGISSLLVLQVTFTDAAMTAEAARDLDMPLAIWAVPEPRLGGRLRLNAFCGLNLASHALGLNGRAFGWLYADPDTVAEEDIAALLDGGRQSGHLTGVVAEAPAEPGRTIAAAMRGRRIGRIGQHPDGFDTCAYAPGKLAALAGVTVDEIALEHLFDTARAVPAAGVSAIRAVAEGQLDGLDAVDQAELDRSLRLKAALSQMGETGGYEAFAIRCWPETFTEYGGAVCGPVSMMGESRLPCACEADVYGALTQMILQETAGAPVFLTDLVDVDTADDSAVVWHCGQAPISMLAAGARAEATNHTNRKMPLLFQFALKPGRVTLARVSQAFGRTQMILAGAQMLDRPMAFTGTSGTLRFDSGAQAALDAIIASGLEHHMALAYGDHRAALRSVAAALSIPVLEI
ncbi:L-fucose/L-arabinose isomerase family protein [Zhengella sp. ZM62]|uniref:L-fucose/L-arabinose isomerase family protein n=1 Tax=Zhengella sedimenti TaxID=3390035 RepID=UPI0039761445